MSTFSRVRANVLAATLVATAGMTAFPDPARADDPGDWVRVWRPEKPGGVQFVGPMAAVEQRDYGSFRWIRVPAADRARLAAGGTLVDVRHDAFQLNLGGLRFDPLDGLPERLADAIGTPTQDKRLRLVQFAGPAKDDWLAELHAAGLEIVQYIPPFTYAVWGPQRGASDISRHTAVRWTGEFLPAYRLQQQRSWTPNSIETVRVLLVRAADIDDTLDSIESLGGEVSSVRYLNGPLAIAGITIDTSLCARLALIPGVYSVQAIPTDGGARSEMSNQVLVNHIDDQNQAYPGYLDWLDDVSLSGAGVTIANVDQGVQQDHPDLAARMLPCVGETCAGEIFSYHGTHTAGIMVGDGSAGTLDSFGFIRGLGVAPGANLIEQRYSPFYYDPGGMLLLMSDSQANGALISGNSWGPSGAPQGYDDDTMQVDIGVRDADPDTPGDQPLIYVLSIMNGYGGTSSMGSPDEAKNIIAVGSTKMQTSSGSQYLDLDDVSVNSAHGPCLDGRQTPHLVAPGCQVDSTLSLDSYGLMCGTSMASPHVSGALALFIEYYRDLPGYTNDPSPALVKAAVLPICHDLAGNSDADGGTLGHRPDSKQGWGRMNLAALVNPAEPVLYFDQETLFDDTGATWSQTVYVANPYEPVRVMLTWTDAPGHGLGGYTPAWNNDLDLLVDHRGATFRGNVFGPGGWSITGSTAEYQNNAEGVLIGPSSGGRFEITILAADINSDGVPNAGDATDQDFALVCYNATTVPVFGDLDTDEDVDAADLASAIDCWSGPDNTHAAGCEPADFELDADVDLADFAALQLSVTDDATP